MNGDGVTDNTAEMRALAEATYFLVSNAYLDAMDDLAVTAGEARWERPEPKAI